MPAPDRRGSSLRADPEQDQQRGVGVPDLPDPGGLPEVVHDEKIIGFDDTLSLSFLRAGLEVARSVSMISVPRFENGQQVLTQGVPWVSRATAWLVAPQLALTNHHVVMPGSPASRTWPRPT